MSLDDDWSTFAELVFFYVAEHFCGPVSLTRVGCFSWAQNHAIEIKIGNHVEFQLQTSLRSGSCQGPEYKMMGSGETWMLTTIYPINEAWVR